jgi:dihydropteroate synthase
MTVINSFTINDHVFHWGQKTYIMGILNVTPDSFSDGGQFNEVEKALNQAKKMILAGADIIDIGGQSTRPGATQITLEAELQRVIPIIQALRAESSIPISIDTTRSDVAFKAVAAGASLVNDISGGTFDPEMLPLVAKLDIPIILMHIRGNPQTMGQLTDYHDLIGEICQFLQTQINQALQLGIKKSHLIIDPGIGFAKTYEQNLQLIRGLSAFKKLGLPILVGPSRKSFIGQILQQNEPQKRVWGTAAACCSAIAGGADIVRVHDVAEMYDLCRVADALWRSL